MNITVGSFVEFLNGGDRIWKVGSVRSGKVLITDKGRNYGWFAMSLFRQVFFDDFGGISYNPIHD